MNDDFSNSQALVDNFDRAMKGLSESINNASGAIGSSNTPNNNNINSANNAINNTPPQNSNPGEGSTGFEGIPSPESMNASTEAMNHFSASSLVAKARITAISQAGKQMSAAFFQMGQAGKLSATILAGAAKSMAVNVIKGVATQAMVKAAFETAEGLAAAARYDFVSAGAHFKAAGTYAAIGAVAGIAAGALSSDSSGSEKTKSNDGGSGENTTDTRVKQTIIINGDLEKSQLDKLKKQQESQNEQLQSALIGG